MKRIKTYILVYIVLLLVACNFNSKKEKNVYQKVLFDKREYKLKFNYKIKEQKSYKRKFKQIKQEFLFKIGGINDTILISPISIIEKKKKIYILDQGDYNIKILNLKGELIRSVGKYGKGPGEFLMPTRFSVSNSEKIIIADYGVNRLSVFGDSLCSLIKSKYPISELSFISDSEFIVLNFVVSETQSYIEKYDLQGNKICRFASIYTNNLPSIISYNVSMQGDLLKTKKNNVVFVPGYFDHFVVFSPEGKIKYSIKKIAKMGIASIKFFRKNGMIVSNTKQLHNYNSTVTSFIISDKLFCYTIVRIDNKNKGIIDVYNLKDGEYVFSYRLPSTGSFTNITFTDERNYIIRPDGSIDVYRVNYGE